MSTRNRDQIRVYEREFLEGLLEGQDHPPRWRWCECIKYIADTPVANPKCEKCKGEGYVYIGS
jgi:hypothetical protein